MLKNEPLDVQKFDGAAESELLQISKISKVSVYYACPECTGMEVLST